MSEGSDLKDHALNSSHDFYDLLSISPASQESEIRRAYRKTALKYHPDKVGNDQAALDKFHLLQIAYDVLSDPDVRQLYDNARRAREEKKERDAAYDSRRRALKEDLERRESAGVAGFKRKREEADEEEAFQRELKRLAADGARRRKEREDMLRKEAQDEYEREQREQHDEVKAKTTTPTPTGVQESAPLSEVDRTVTLRWPAEVSIDREQLEKRFSRFGKISEVVISSKPKKIKIEGEKHRREYTTAIIVFENVAAAYMAITQAPSLADEERNLDSSERLWTPLEAIYWASGKEPDHGIPKKPAANGTPKEKVAFNRALFNKGLSTPTPALKEKPSFSSFKKTPK